MAVYNHCQTPRQAKEPLNVLRALLSVTALALAACAAQTGPNLGDPVAQRVIPPIDLAVPQQIETATFALG